MENTNNINMHAPEVEVTNESEPEPGVTDESEHDSSSEPEPEGIVDEPEQEVAHEPEPTNDQEEIDTNGEINQYELYRALEVAVHGTVIREGHVLERLIHEAILNSGAFNEVINGKSIPLNPDICGGRRNHKVDIFCIDHVNRRIVAYNSKGKSFNNTESSLGLLQEYNRYRDAIQAQYPDYDITYAILKDQYDPNNNKFSKYVDLNNNGIPVFNTMHHLQSVYNIDFNQINIRREQRVIDILRTRIQNSGFTVEEVLSLLFS